LKDAIRLQGLRFVGFEEASEPEPRMSYPIKTQQQYEFLFHSLSMGRNWMQIFFPPREELLTRLNRRLKGFKLDEPHNWRGLREEDLIDKQQKFPYSGTSARNHTK